MSQAVPPESGEIVLYAPNERDQPLQVRLEGETVWLTQRQLSELYQTTPQNITIHIREIYKDGELTPEATCKDYLQVRSEGAGLFDGSCCRTWGRAIISF